MSSGLQIRLSKYLWGTEVPRNGVVANVYALDPERHANSKRNLVIPVGSGNSFQSVELEPGHYLVEAIMPSGDIVSLEAVAVEGQWPKVELSAEESAHEWHSWQNLLGNVRSRSGYEAFTEKTALPNYNVLLCKNLWPELRWELFSPFPDVWQVLADISRYGHSDDVRVIHRLFPWFWYPPEPLNPSDSDWGTQLHSFLMNHQGSRTEVPRWYALVSSERAARLLTIPSPWFSFGSEVPSELLVTKSDDQSIGTSWVVGDTVLGTVLGYLAKGAYQLALNVASQDYALNLLFEKFDNPLGAAAGGYLLIGAMKSVETENRPEFTDWHKWIGNLMNYFEWLPDGAIQYAWLKLKQGGLADGRAEAREALFRAFDRGLPYYSLGLQWLVDGLTLLGDDDDEAVRRRREAQRVAWLADMSSLFTAVTLAG